MATVTNTIKLPGEITPTHAAVEIELVASTTAAAAGWVTATDITILSKYRPTVTDGEWSADLTPNADITPSGTVYRITEYADRHRYVHYIEVGSGGGSVFDLLVDQPGSLASAASELYADAAVAALDYRLSDPLTSDHAFIDPFLTPRIVVPPTRLTIPTYEGSGTVVHPSVVFFRGGWNGWRYWMAFTPYPSTNSAYENPSIVASNDGVTWAVPTGLTNPIDPDPGGITYNSDVCLTFDAGYLYCVWRETSGASGYDRLLYSRSADGVTWTAQTEMWSTSSAAQRLVSPTVMREPDGSWSMWAIDIVPSPNTMVKLTAPTVGGTWTLADTCTGVSVSGKDVWHGEVRLIGSTYFLLVNENTLDSSGTGILHLFTSPDGVAWREARSFPGPSLNLYKSSFLPAGPNQMEVWWGSNSAFYHGIVAFGEAPAVEIGRGLAAAVRPIAPYTTGDIVDRANNGSTPGTSSSGHAWSVTAGTVQVASNALGGTAAANHKAVLAAGHANGRFGCRVKVFSAQTWLMFRVQDAVNYWRFGWYDASTMFLQKVVSGSTSDVWTWTTLTAASGDLLEAICFGSRIVCRLNGNVMVETYDSTFSTATAYGFQTNNATARFDQFHSVNA